VVASRLVASRTVDRGRHSTTRAGTALGVAAAFHGRAIADQVGLTLLDRL
jgi:hypothetical protein